MLAVSVCLVVRQLVGTFAYARQLRPLIQSALRKDYRGVALEAVRAALSSSTRDAICCGRDEAQCKAWFDVYGQFGVSLTSYVMMDRSDAEQSEGARAAFRRSAYEKGRLQHL